MPINHKQNKALGFCAFLLLTIALLSSFTGLAEQVIAGEGPVTWSSEDDWKNKEEKDNILIEGDEFQLEETAGLEKAWIRTGHIIIYVIGLANNFLTAL